MNRESTRFCPRCGAANPVSARTCPACRAALATGSGSPGGALALSVAAGNREHAWSPAAAAAQETAPIAGGHGRRFEPEPYVIRQQAFDQPGYAPGARPIDAGPPPARRGSRGGCVMGVISFGLICVLIAVLGGLLIGRPLLEDAVADRLQRAVSTEVIRELEASVNADGIAPGTYVLREDEINTELAADPDKWEPLDTPTVSINRDGFEIRFEVFGLESGYRGMVEADRGRLVLTDVEADGAAAQVLSTRELREIVEEELNAYFARNGLQVTDVELGRGELTVVTSEAGAPLTDNSARPTRTPAADDDDADADAEAPELLPTSTRAPRPSPTPGGLFGPRPTRAPTANEA